MRAEDILPDAANERSFDGIPIRKGSVGAFLVNARTLEDPNATESAKNEARQDIVDLLPALRALGFFDIFEIRSEPLRDFVANH
jgi:hypothetical protein